MALSTIYEEDDFLQLSGIQHYCFCKRQWALIHIEKAWDDNSRTKEGDLLHKNVDNPFFTENRRNITISRSVPVKSHVLGLSGLCDVVVFEKSDEGSAIMGKPGKYIVYPIEYKAGSPKKNLSDSIQLCAQVISLEEMLNTQISEAYFYYAKPRKRTMVEMSQELREKTTELSKDMHNDFKFSITPKAKQTIACEKCSLQELCLPNLSKVQSVKKYIDLMRE